MRILIVGAGIAGTTLGHHLMERGVAVKIIDKGANHSSAVAAGILNPLVFRRMTLSWRAETMMPGAALFYRKIEALLQQSFYTPIPIRRLFSSNQEREFWLKKQTLPVFDHYMKFVDDEDEHFKHHNNTNGTGLVNHSAYVDSEKYMQANWNYFVEHQILEWDEVKYIDFDVENGLYKGEQYDHIIFCEGKDNLNNPWFGGLPIQQTKGEILTIQTNVINQHESLNRKCFLLPVGDHQFKVGSTYEWDIDNIIPTKEGKTTILENLTSVFDGDYKITNHVAGVRPTVPDRRPILGKHPEFPKITIANGLGAKGYLLAPLLMQELVEHLLDGKELNLEVKIERYLKWLHKSRGVAAKV